MEITGLLAAAQRGDRAAFDAVMPLVYAELHHLARNVRRGSGEGSLQTTELVHEAYLKLLPSQGVTWEGRSHFLAIAARAMRQVLVDEARRRASQKRGGDQTRITLDVEIIGQGPSAEDVLALDELLGELERLSERQARIVECRVFAGLTLAEVGGALGISEATVQREWRMARAWLSRGLRGHES